MEAVRNLERRYRVLKISLLASVLIATFAFPVIAANISTQHTTGHIRVLNGADAGLLVSPSFLDFGDVQWGTTLTKIITVMNTGTCIEHVTAVSTTPPQDPSALEIPNLFPGKSVNVTATYDSSKFLPGDYSFGFDWTATCL